jgi:ubiquinone/menaquinone biosynthesis C-methylase UbiE
MAIERLSAEEWARHYNPELLESVIRDAKAEAMNLQTEQMVKHTVPGSKVLEIGSGSGVTSLSLSIRGRVCTALDYSEPSLELVRRAAERLGCSVRTVFGDATAELGFDDDEFDVVFQAGLLEHFSKDERISMLKLWRRFSKKMVSIIPNAASLAYRVGKARMERNGTWAYGLEMPQYSLCDDFQRAGFMVTEEYSVGETHGLEFLAPSDPLRKALAEWIRTNECSDNCGQGYLLVTIGEKA